MVYCSVLRPQLYLPTPAIMRMLAGNKNSAQDSRVFFSFYLLHLFSRLIKILRMTLFTFLIIQGYCSKTSLFLISKIFCNKFYILKFCKHISKQVYYTESFPSYYILYTYIYILHTQNHLPHTIYIHILLMGSIKRNVLRK